MGVIMHNFQLNVGYTHEITNLIKWCEEQFGPMHSEDTCSVFVGKWWYNYDYNMSNTWRIFYFREEKHKTLFILRWS